MCAGPLRWPSRLRPHPLVTRIDKAFAARKSSGATDGGTTARVFGTFLTWAVGKKRAGVRGGHRQMTFALPPELLPRGRLDEIFLTLDLPSEEERGEIFRIHTGQARPRPEKFDLPALVAGAGIRAARKSRKPSTAPIYDAFLFPAGITTEHVLTALAQTVPLAKNMDEKSAICGMG